MLPGKENPMTHFKPRQDAVWLNNPPRRYVPTVYGQQVGNTIWVTTWKQFREVGGELHYSEDQTEIVLTLPEGHKFGIRFQEPQS